MIASANQARQSSTSATWDRLSVIRARVKTRRDSKFGARKIRSKSAVEAVARTRRVSATQRSAKRVESCWLIIFNDCSTPKRETKRSRESLLHRGTPNAIVHRQSG